MACPFCALGLHHYASIAQVEQAFRQRVLLVHPDKRMPEFQEQAAVEFKLLYATRDLALRYTNPGVMPFICPGPAIPNPVPIRAATGLPAYMPFGAATRWPAAGSRDRPDLDPEREGADQETNPADITTCQRTDCLRKFIPPCNNKKASYCCRQCRNGRGCDHGCDRRCFRLTQRSYGTVI